MGALEMLEYEYMSIYKAPLLLLPLSRLYQFNCLSIGNKQSLCPLMWGAQEKSEGHIKKFAAGALRRHCASPLANCFRCLCQSSENIKGSQDFKSQARPFLLGENF